MLSFFLKHWLTYKLVYECLWYLIHRDVLNVLLLCDWYWMVWGIPNELWRLDTFRDIWSLSLRRTVAETCGSIFGGPVVGYLSMAVGYRPKTKEPGNAESLGTAMLVCTMLPWAVCFCSQAKNGAVEGCDDCHVMGLAHMVTQNHTDIYWYHIAHYCNFHSFLRANPLEARAKNHHFLCFLCLNALQKRIPGCYSAIHITYPKDRRMVSETSRLLPGAKDGLPLKFESGWGLDDRWHQIQPAPVVFTSHCALCYPVLHCATEPLKLPLGLPASIGSAIWKWIHFG